jgi:hypothetical protein
MNEVQKRAQATRLAQQKQAGWGTCGRCGDWKKIAGTTGPEAGVCCQDCNDAIRAGQDD